MQAKDIGFQTERYLQISIPCYTSTFGLCAPQRRTEIIKLRESAAGSKQGAKTGLTHMNPGCVNLLKFQQHKKRLGSMSRLGHALKALNPKTCRLSSLHLELLHEP